MLLAAATTAVIAGVCALLALVSIELAAQVLTWVSLELALLLSVGGLYCVTRWAYPRGRLDSSAASLTPPQGWQLKALAGTGSAASCEETQLLSAFLGRAESRGRPVVVAAAQVGDRCLLTGEQRLVRVPVPGASRR